MGEKVAIIGTGRMGSAAAERLSSQEYDVIVWNRTREKAEKLASKINARVSTTPFEAVQEATYALLFLSDENAIFQVLSGFHRMDGAIIIDHATITPQASKRFEGFVKAMGGCYVEAPVLGGPSAVRNGKALFIAAGERVCLNSAKPLLTDLAGELIIVGHEPEIAAAIKLAFNSLLIGTIELLAESTVMVESYGVKADKFKEILSKTVFSAIANKYIDRMRKSPEEEASFALKLAMKDLEYALRAGYPQGIPQPAIAGALNMYRTAVRLGFSGSDYTRIYYAVKGGARRA